MRTRRPRPAMEVHFVHKSADGQLAVVGALMQPGAGNLALREMWSHMAMEAGPVRPNARPLQALNNHLVMTPTANN